MTNLESLRSLQKRIREAKGSDRALDADIAEAIGGWTSYPGDNWIGPRGQICVPSFTLDPDGLGPCVALLEAVLPCRSWKRDYAGDIFIRGGYYARPLANDCLTFLDAIFSAAIAQEEAKEKADA